jgi:hypothetical protein
MSSNVYEFFQHSCDIYFPEEKITISKMQETTNEEEATIINNILGKESEPSTDALIAVL